MSLIDALLCFPRAVAFSLRAARLRRADPPAGDHPLHDPQLDGPPPRGRRLRFDHGHPGGRAEARSEGGPR